MDHSRTSTTNVPQKGPNRERKRIQPEEGYEKRRSRCEPCQLGHFGGCHVPLGTTGPCGNCQKAGKEQECKDPPKKPRKTTANLVHQAPLPSLPTNLSQDLRRELHQELEEKFEEKFKELSAKLSFYTSFHGNGSVGSLAGVSSTASNDATTQPFETSIPVDPLSSIEFSSFSTRIDNSNPLSSTVAGIFASFKAPLNHIIHQDGANKIASFLAFHYLWANVTLLDIRARLLDSNGQGIERNAMYVAIEWVEQTQQEGKRVAAVVKITKFDLFFFSLVLCYRSTHPQPDPRRAQSRYQWFAWENEESDDLRDILIAGQQELGLLSTMESTRNREVILWWGDWNPDPIPVDSVNGQNFYERIAAEFRDNSIPGKYPDNVTHPWQFHFIGNSQLKLRDGGTVR